MKSIEIKIETFQNYVFLSSFLSGIWNDMYIHNPTWIGYFFTFFPMGGGIGYMGTRPFNFSPNEASE